MRQPTTAARERITRWLAGLTAAAFILIGAQLYPPGGGPQEPISVILFASFLLMSVSGFALGRYATTTNYWPIGLCTFAGICGGVLLNSIYDFQVHHVDHDLFPFEIVIDSFLIIPGMIGGVAIARSVDEDRRANANDDVGAGGRR